MVPIHLLRQEPGAWERLSKISTFPRPADSAVSTAALVPYLFSLASVTSAEGQAWYVQT